MAKKQTRRAISVRGVTYAALFADCQARRVSVSDHLEQLIAADRQARGLPSIVAPDRSVAAAAIAVQREGALQVERAVEAVRAVPLPAVSSIKVGPPPEQTAMLGRTTTPPRKESQRGAALRPIVHAAAQYGLLRRQPQKAALTIPAGHDVPRRAGQDSARPLRGERVEPAAKPRPVTRADPVGGIHTGARGGAPLL